MTPLLSFFLTLIEGAPPSSRSGISGWRVGSLYPLAGGAERRGESGASFGRRRRFRFYASRARCGRGRGSASPTPARNSMVMVSPTPLFRGARLRTFKTKFPIALQRADRTEVVVGRRVSRSECGSRTITVIIRSSSFSQKRGPMQTAQSRFSILSRLWLYASLDIALFLADRRVTASILHKAVNASLPFFTSAFSNRAVY
jgi:hypothetical protein